MDRCAEAIQSAEKAVLYDDQYLANHLALIEAHMAKKDFKEAMNVVKKCQITVNEHEQDFELLLKIAQIYMELGQTTEGETLYREILKKRADTEEEWIIKAEVCEMQGKDNDAVKWYKKVFRQIKYPNKIN